MNKVCLVVGHAFIFCFLLLKCDVPRLTQWTLNVWWWMGVISRQRQQLFIAFLFLSVYVGYNSCVPALVTPEKLTSNQVTCERHQPSSLFGMNMNVNDVGQPQIEFIALCEEFFTTFQWSVWIARGERPFTHTSMCNWYDCTSKQLTFEEKRKKEMDRSIERGGGGERVKENNWFVFLLWVPLSKLKYEIPSFPCETVHLRFEEIPQAGPHHLSGYTISIEVFESVSGRSFFCIS